MRIRLGFLSLALVLGGLGGSVAAAPAWDESVDGDLSTDPAAPTAVVFDAGSNVVSGTVTSNTPSDTRDYITFTIIHGKPLAELRQLQYTDVPSGDPGNTGFHAIIAGATSQVPGAGNIGDFLGSNHFEPLPVGTDMLPDLAAAFTGGQGFSTPLGPGTYTYHIQQTGTQVVAYSVEFVLLPEPTSLALAGMGLIGLVWRRRS